MKKLVVHSLLFIVLCSAAQGANEINAFAPGVTTAYAMVRQADGDVWYPVGQVWEAYGTGGRTAADYDLALADKSGDMFVGNMDTNITAQFCHIVTCYQAGGAPADSDPVIWAEYGYWSGTTWTVTTVTAASIADSVWDEASADHSGEATFGGELQSLDPNITLILEDTGTTIPALIAALPTVAGLADAVWDEAMAGHTGELTFGGELQTLDPNITLILADTNELQTDWTNGGRLDLIIDAIKAVTDVMQAVNSSVETPNDANNFIITNTGDINDVNDAYAGMTVMVQDATTGDWESRLIDTWETGRSITVDADFTFTPEAGDVVIIWAVSYFPLDVYLSLPSPPDPQVLNVDYRTVPTGGTSVGGSRTLNAGGDDP